MRSIFEWVEQTYGPGVMQEAWREFSLWDDLAPPLERAKNYRQLFMPWFAHTWRPGVLASTHIENPRLHSRSPTAAYLESGVEKRDPSFVRYLAQCVATPFGFHEVLRAEDPTVLKLRNLHTGENYEECHRTVSQPALLSAGNILYGQCVELHGRAQLEASAPQAIPARYKAEILDRCHSVMPQSEMTAAQRCRHDLKRRAVYFDVAGEMLADKIDLDLSRAG